MDMLFVVVILLIVIVAVIVIVRNKKIQEELKNRAIQGDKQAQYELSIIYQRTKPIEARHYLEQAAENEHTLAQIALAMQYKDGKMDDKLKKLSDMGRKVTYNGPQNLYKVLSSEPRRKKGVNVRHGSGEEAAHGCV